MKKTIFSVMFAMVISMMIGCTKSTPATTDDVDSTTVEATVVDSTVVAPVDSTVVEAVVAEDTTEVK